MTDWANLVRPSLHGLEPYDPGPSADELRRSYGVDEIVRLNRKATCGSPLRFANGAVASTSIAWTRVGLPGRYSVDVLGSESSLHLELDPDFTVSGVSRGREINAATRQHPIERSAQRFVEAAREGDRSRVFSSPDGAVGTLAVVVACEEAFASGGTVSVPAV